jgi:GR25 family glycosyltransferase involved in LPS biosynthesis
MLMENIQEIYVINLKKCTNRMKKFDDNMKYLNLKYKRWDAVNGSTLKKTDANTTFLCRNFMCTNGVIGCYLSHITLWRHILAGAARSNKWFMIFEDDARFTPKAINNLKNVFQDIQNWQSDKLYPDMINLACVISEKAVYRKITEHIFQPFVVNGMTAYIVSIPGIKKLLSILDKPVIWHIDNLLTVKQLYNKKIGYYSTHNYIVNTDELQSTISGNSFPRIEVDILNNIMSQFNINSQIHVIYNSIICGNSVISFNTLTMFFVVIVGLLLSYDLYDIAVLYIFAEILYWYYIKSKKSSPC